MNKSHRVFVAINLPEDIKRSLASYQNNWPELPVRWTKPENLHITLEFLGYLTDEELVEVCEKTKEMADRYNPFELKLSNICYGPLGKPPRMIWVIGPEIKEISLAPHITLGRIRKWEWQRLDPEDRPEINQDIDLQFSVNSIEVMESALKRGGAEYTILESYSLKN